ncbi:MAG: sigma-70 family RNA polymerase sigma factor [Bacteroidota bacterium]
MTDRFDDKALLKAIHKGGRQLEQAMHYLLRKSGWQEGIGQYIKSKSGSREDVEDVFQEGVRHLIVNVRAGRFHQNSSVKTYLSSICKNLWYTKFTREVKLKEIKNQLPPAPEGTPGPEHHLILNEKKELLNSVLDQLGNTCKKVLSLWSLGFSFKEIGEETSQSAGTVRKQKFDCMKKLTSLMAARPDLVKALKE